MIKVFANGAWQTKVETFDAEGKPMPPTDDGCFAQPDVKKLTTTSLHGAEAGRSRPARVHCMAMTAAYTVYRVNGKSVFIRKLCSGDSLDDKSMTKLDTGPATVDRAASKAP